MMICFSMQVKQKEKVCTHDERAYVIHENVALNALASRSLTYDLKCEDEKKK
jgi:hypothetical protein